MGHNVPGDLKKWSELISQKVNFVRSSEKIIYSKISSVI